MKLHTLLLASAVVIAAVAPLLSAPQPPGERAMFAWAFSTRSLPGSMEKQDDPGYGAYKSGYNLVLEERWEDARKKFAEVLTKYPKSEYADDAAYWSAYALRHIDYKQARKAYEEFIKKYPKSSYYDDAVADLATISAETGLNGVYLPDSSLLFMRVPRLPATVLGPDFRHEMGQFNEQMRRLRWNVRKMGRDMHNGLRYSYVTPRFDEEDELDPKIRLKLEALSALGEGKHDQKGFETLKGIALDQKQPVVLRMEAIRVLGEFKEHPVSPVLLDIAKNDTSEDLQVAAIGQLKESAKNKDEAIGMLTQLFESLPSKREEQRASLLYEIANVGNDKAIDFLIKVARSDPNYDLRSDAVYYLGSVGGEKARTAIYDILEGK